MTASTIFVLEATGNIAEVQTIKGAIDDLAAVDESNPLAVELQGSSAQIGRVGGNTPRVTATFTRGAGAAGAYALGDHIANSETAASVVPMEFTAARFSNGSGRITGAQCILEAASGASLVLPAFDLLLFRPSVNIPFEAGSYPADNAVLNVSVAAFKDLVAVFPFTLTGWRNRNGGVAASGLYAYQATSLSSRQYATFSLEGLGSQKLIGIIQAQSTWNPGAIAQTFSFSLDVDQD